MSHSSEEATEKWIIVCGGEWDTTVIVDPDREIYAAWGLGVSSTWHALNPWSIWSAYKLGKNESIWNQPTESGTRWQTSGTFAVDKAGVVKWASVAKAADDIPNLKEVLEALAIVS